MDDIYSSSLSKWRCRSADPALGNAKVYSYVVMGGTANLQYIHPALRSLSVTDETDNALSMEPALNYSITESSKVAATAFSTRMEPLPSRRLRS